MRKHKTLSFLMLIALFSLSSCGPTNQYLTADDPGTATIKIFKNNNSTSKSRYIAPKNVELKYTHNSLNGKLISSFASNCPSVGDVNLLIIPVKIPGSDFFMDDEKREIVKQDIELAFFGEESDRLGNPSVKSFYKESSFGKLNLSGTVTDWFDVRQNVGIFNSMNITSGVDGNIGNEILLKAVEWAEETQNINLNDFDNDKDGAIDGVWLIYDHLDYASHIQYCLKNNIVPTSSNINQAFWNFTYESFTSGFPKQGETIAVPYSWISFTSLYTGYCERDEEGMDIFDDLSSMKVGTHTLIHEQGHLFGLPDLYSTTEEGISPTGKSTMMDLNICDLDSYSKMCLGWITPYVVYGTSEILLPKANYSDNCVIVIPSNYEEISSLVELANKQNRLEEFKYEFNPFSEYLMIDLYTPDGLNFQDSYKAQLNDREYGIDTSGVRIYHVDSRIFKANVIKSDLGVTFNYVDGYEWNGNNISNTQAILCPISNSKIESSSYQLPLEYDNYDRIRLLEASGFNTFADGHWASDLTLFTPETDDFDIEKFGYRFFNSNYGFNDGNDIPFKVRVETLKGVNVDEIY